MKALSPPRTGATRGMTLLELMVVMAIITIALGEVTRAMLTISKLEPMSREADMALHAAATQLDAMRGMPFETLVARYNNKASDDPDGPGTAPGRSFPIPGLGVREDDGDGMAGKVELPMQGSRLLEDIEDIELGMPRDLNLDGSIDNDDHSFDYAILPIRIIVEWSSQGRDHQVQLTTTLTSRG